MKSNMKKILTLSLCVCMLMSGTAYAQEERTDSQEKVTLEEQKAEEDVGEQQEGTAEYRNGKRKRRIADC